MASMQKYPFRKFTFKSEVSLCNHLAYTEYQLIANQIAKLWQTINHTTLTFWQYLFMVKHQSYFSVQGCETVRENNKLELDDRSGDCCITSWTEKEICTFTKRHRQSLPLQLAHLTFFKTSECYNMLCCDVYAGQSKKHLIYA